MDSDSWPAMIEVGSERRWRHGIDGVRRNERLDIVEVRIRRILRGSGSPERALEMNPPFLQLCEACGGEYALECLVRNPRVGDCHSSSKIARSLPLALLATCVLRDGVEL